MKVGFLSMTVEIALLFIVVGACVGGLSGLLGIGGGLVLVPFFSAVFTLLNLPANNVFHYALGTSMACIVLTSAFSLMAHQRKQGVLWHFVKSMALGVVLGAFFSTFWVASLKSTMLMIIFSVFLVFVAWQMLSAHSQQAEDTSPAKVSSIELFMVSTLIGVISAIVSIGGGSLTVPYLTHRKVPIKQAIGTSAALGLPISLAGTLGYIYNGPAIVWLDQIPLTLGYIYLPAVLFVSITSVFTVKLGANLVHRLPVNVIKRIFACLLIVISIKVLWSGVA
jgi:uncharacterized protein